MAVGCTTEDDETKVEPVVEYFHEERSYVGTTYSEESFECEYATYIRLLTVCC